LDDPALMHPNAPYMHPELKKGLAANG